MRIRRKVMKLVVFVLFFVSIGMSAISQEMVIPDLQSPPQQISIFAPGIVSTSMNERDFAISPDGNEIYYTISTPKSTFQTIVFTRRIAKGRWTSPEIVSFAGEYSDLEPAFSPDGKFLYFASNRPIDGNKSKDFDIWRVARSGSTWGMPENLGPVVNSSADEFYPSIAINGNLYFTASYEGGPGKEDIYLAEFVNGSFNKPVPLDSGVNSPYYEFNAFVSPDEQYILYTSYGRKDDTGGGDLYLSRRDESGAWQAGVNLKEINSPQLDYCPYVSPDGKILFVTSERHQLPRTFSGTKATYKKVQELSSDLLNGSGNIYWIDFKKVLKR